MNEESRKPSSKSDSKDFYRNASRDVLITEMIGNFEDINSDIPTIVCQYDSLMIYANEAAKYYLKGDVNVFLKSYIDDTDNLNIAAMTVESAGERSSAPDHLLIRLISFHGFACALVKKLNIFGHGFIALFLFRSKLDYLHLEKIMSENAAAVIGEINRRSVSADSKLQAQQIAFSSLVSGYDKSDTSNRFDVVEAMRRIIRDVSENVITIDCSFNFTESKLSSHSSFITQIPLGIFIKLSVAALFVMNDVTLDQKINISYLHDDTSTTIRLHTEKTRFPLNFIRSCEMAALRDVMPSCTMQLIMCDYLAASTGCRISASGSTSDDSLTVSIHVPTESKPVDFRSADQFEGYDDFFNEAICLIMPR